MTPALPPNVHLSTHPCIQAKISQLRSQSTNARETGSLIHEIATLIGCEATAANLTTSHGSKGTTAIGVEYTTTLISPTSIALIPILRSGLGMVQAIQSILPDPVPVHHLGLYREPSTLQPVEYYNNLPYHRPNASAATSSTPTTESNSSAAELAILLDPVIATGGTCAAAIQTLKEWGVKRVVVIAVIAAVEGVTRAANEWPEASEIWIAALDGELTSSGMIKPGLGDVGDRLFLTLGK